MNALRDIKSVQEIEVRLQTNEVLLHLLQDTPISAATEAIYEAGYTPDETVWLTAAGTWNKEGFLPQGWEKAIALTPSQESKDGIWEFKFVLINDKWTFESLKSVTTVPQVRDEDTK